MGSSMYRSCPRTAGVSVESSVCLDQLRLGELGQRTRRAVVLFRRRGFLHLRLELVVEFGVAMTRRNRNDRASQRSVDRAGSFMYCCTMVCAC